jgi:GTP-binding protein
MYHWIIEHGFQPIVIATKADKINRSQLDKQRKLIQTTLSVVPGTPIIPFSSVTKQGREEIWELIDRYKDYTGEA